MFLRNVYFSLPVRLRYLIRRMFYLPTDVFARSGEDMVPPKGLIYTGSGDFIEVGNKNVQFFISQAGLLKTHTVLDIGSGIGRNAVPLTKYLEGDYYGFDVVEKGVQWCKKRISSKYPNFRFDYFDLFNDLYKDEGKDASIFEFPYKEDYFDFIFCISLFTHFLPDDLENYIEQIARVMKDEGTVVATFFLVNELRKRDLTVNKDFTFTNDYGHYYLMNNKVKSANVAYDLDYVLNLLAKNGLVAKTVNLGFWYDGNYQKNRQSDFFQDILIIKKA